MRGSFSRLWNIPRGELSFGRIWRALWRRIAATPDHLAWELARKRENPSIERLKAFKDVHRGERCFIMGNGPSLARTDIELLRNEFTFGLNRIYLLSETKEFVTDYFVSINDLVLQQSIKEISALRMPKFINWRARQQYKNVDNLYFLLERYKPGFSSNPMRGLWGGATVTFVALQLAYFMGFETVILVGVDHSFSSSGTPHAVVTGQEQDNDHFHPKYFADGTRWQLPDLTTSEYAYSLARETFEADGRRVLDATIDGKLQVFPKVDYYSLF